MRRSNLRDSRAVQWIARAVGLVGLTALLFGSATSAFAEQAEPRTLAILPVIIGEKSSDGKGVSASGVYQAVTEAAAFRKSLRLISIDQYFFHDGGALADRAGACGNDPECISTQLAPFRADLGLVVIANVSGDTQLLSAILLDLRQRRILNERHGEVRGPASGILKALTVETAALFDRARLPRWGRLALDLDPRDAAVRVGDGAKPDIGNEHLFTLPPGRYNVFAQSDGHADGRTSVAIQAGQTTNLSMTLEKQTSVLQSPWFWIATSAAVVAAGVTVSAIALSSPSNCICLVTNENTECSACE